MKRAALWPAIVAAVAVGIAGGATTAAPAQADSTPPATLSTTVTAIHGIQRGVGYLAAVTPDGGGVVTTLESGTFTASADEKSILVADAAGAPVGEVPLTLTAAGQEISLTPAIDNNGSTLTLRPSKPPLHDVNAQENWNEQLQRGTFGALIGGAIGGVIGALFWWLVLPPFIGAGIGAGIGFLAAGGQPLIDAGIAYFTGQP